MDTLNSIRILSYPWICEFINGSRYAGVVQSAYRFYRLLLPNNVD